MTEKQFIEIKKRLAKWRKGRHLSYKNQREEFLGNVFKKVGEYFRAKNDYESMNALCDIAIFFINSFKFEYETTFSYVNVSNDDFTRHLIYRLGDIIEKNKELDLEFAEIHLGYGVLVLIENMVSELNFDFHKCMLEKIKEIESQPN